MEISKFQKVTSKRDRDCCHTAGLDHQQQSPAIQKCDERMIGIAEISVLAANFRPQRCELRPDECRSQRDEPTQSPNEENQEWRGNALGNNIRIDEDAGAD